MKDKQIEYLYLSISDTQNNIRAIDVKLGFFFVVIFLPVTALDKIQKAYGALNSFLSLELMSYFAFAFWLLAIFFLFNAIVAVRSPTSIIDNLNSVNDCSFYNSDLFKLTSIDAFMNFPICSQKKLPQKIGQLPSNRDQLISSLAYEVFKLTYIRDLKVKRLNYCVVCTFSFLSLGVLIWAIQLLD